MKEYQITPTRIGNKETYSDQTYIDLSKLSDETLTMLGWKKEFHFRKFHIFINKDFTNYNFNSGTNSSHHDGYIAKDHKVHIYISTKEVINYEGLRRFVALAKYQVDYPITIHISKRDSELELKIRRLLEGFFNWKLYVENNSTVTPYLYYIDNITGSNDKTYLCIYYYYKYGTERIRYEFYDGKNTIEKDNKFHGIPDIILPSSFLYNFFTPEDTEETIRDTIYNALKYYFKNFS